MSIQSSINQMLGNVGLLANTFQFQKQINKTEDISSQVAQLNEQRAKLEADKAKFKTESDEERANIEKKRSKFSRDVNSFEDYAFMVEDKLNRMWKNGPYLRTNASETGIRSFNTYAAGNAMASNVAQQRVDAEREKRINQVEALQKAFKNIGMGGANDNG